ncbi:hypothetical protein WJX81_008502 [Elliptochloris bilobata]|uniref:Golgi apparatus protein 1 n=1 Tax=Elliptochloris bilobata TaxID=381761 RepID=A0AAW1QL29_9CHLO
MYSRTRVQTGKGAGAASPEAPEVAALGRSGAMRPRRSLGPIGALLALLLATAVVAGAAADADPTAARVAAAADPKAATSAAGADAKALVAKTGAELERAVEANVEAQDYQEETSPVKAQVVQGEPAALLASGTGDISTTGDCQEELDQWCGAVKPGEGRLARCMTDQLSEEAKDGYSGPKTSERCKKTLSSFRIDRAGNINSDLPLARACKADAEKLCANRPTDFSILGCLRDHKDELAAACQEEVFKRQQEAADDWRADKELAAACKSDAEINCKDVPAVGGKVQECLASKRALLSWDCQEQLFRQEVENADDMRLSVRLFRSCLNDKKKFCAEVQPGNARAKECLEDNREKEGFSKPCRDELEKMMAARAADFRLDPKLRQLCARDIQVVCGYEHDSMGSTVGEDARVIQCLQDYRDEIQSQACAARVQKIMEYASSDIRFDVPLADACYEDRQEFCANVPPGSARVIRCLQDRRSDLSYECKATLFDQEVRMAENIDFQFPMKKSCNADIDRFCKDVQHGHAKTIRCLQDNLADPAMSATCKTEVEKHVQHAAQDYRLNYRLSISCHDTIVDKCADACTSTSIEQPCGGTVLRCLTEKMEDITDAECKKEVFYFVKMEVRDFRNDVILAEACRTDVELHCPNVPAGEGRVHQCLRDNREKLSEACRREETKLQIIESSNTELMPNLARACKAERAVHCEGVRPGKARVFNCLLAAAGYADLSGACREHLARGQLRRVRDWRLDYDLRLACKDDVPKVCAAARANEDKGDGAVLQCLVENEKATSENCARETSRAVRNALSFFAPGAPVIGVCDDDVAKHCASAKPMETRRIGEVRECLVALAVPALPEPPMVASLATEEEKAAAAAAGTTLGGEEGPARRLLRRLLADEDRADVVHEEKPWVPAGSAPAPPTGQLSAECQVLVEMANPPDSYEVYTTAISAAAVSTQIKAIESRLGLQEGTLTPANAGDGMLTLTGWSAALGLLAIMVVAVVGAGLAYRRYKGYDQMSTYTLVNKGAGRS